MDHVRRLPLGRRIDFAADAYEAVDGADCAVLVTEWNELRTLDLRRLKRRMRRPLLCDLRNVYEAAEAAAAGLTYVGVGQGTDPGTARKPRRAKPGAARKTRKGKGTR
jgi:UDPglucose 6-dehydrogenase